jgi:YD repeat-containing protein
MTFRGRFAAALILLLCAEAAHASETVNYTYDARGRLVQTAHSGTVNNGLASSYSYDHADNRTNVSVTGGLTSSGGGDGATVPSNLFIVVPLNGYTLIKIR